jgi:hypothetical protein
MHRRFTHVLLLSLLVVSSVAGSTFHRGAAASAPEPQFSAAAAATPTYQSGQVGKVYLPSVPVYCIQYSYEYTQLDESVTTALNAYSALGVSARPGVPNQQVGVRPQLYQRLADGSYQFLAEYEVEVLETVGPVPAAVQPRGSFANLGAGPDYVVGYLIKWYPPSGGTVEDWAIVMATDYVTIVDSVPVLYDQPICNSYWPPNIKISADAGTVNSTVSYALDEYPIHVSVTAKWDGAVIHSTNTNNTGRATGSFLVPAAPMGPHKLTFSYGHWTATKTYTVKPRIKLIPSTVSRGQTVNVSLRGYKAKEVVRIRWKKGTSWVELARVTTSSTGSANVNVKVPTFAPDGPNSVRGDSVNTTGGHAQTNAVMVNGGPMTSSTVKTPTPTPTQTMIPATATSTPTATPSPTTAVTTPEPTATSIVETPTPESTAPPEASPVAQTP